MNIPGFTAESSLFGSRAGHSSVLYDTIAEESGQIVAQEVGWGVVERIAALANCNADTTIWKCWSAPGKPGIYDGKVFGGAQYMGSRACSCLEYYCR